MTLADIIQIVIGVLSLLATNISGTVAIHKLLCDGFILNRENRTQKDLYAVSSAFPTALCLSMSFPSGI